MRLARALPFLPAAGAGILAAEKPCSGVTGGVDRALDGSAIGLVGAEGSARPVMSAKLLVREQGFSMEWADILGRLSAGAPLPAAWPSRATGLAGRRGNAS